MRPSSMISPKKLVGKFFINDITHNNQITEKILQIPQNQKPASVNVFFASFVKVMAIRSLLKLYFVNPAAVFLYAHFYLKLIY